ncbi:MAG TPA: HlyU family transcriptional regulator [Devosia sp.]|nr:HlyU family transcriptional regulator [Devosia sp.]
MSFWKNLFGGGGSAQPQAEPGEEYKGFTIRATPMSAGSEYQLAGVIEKTIEGELRSYKFVRADRMSSRDEAVSFALAKGRQIVDEQGEGVFRQSWPKTS